MPTYIILGKWTQAGMEKLKEVPKRAEMARNAVKSAGGEMKAFYNTFAKYDVVAIAEAPDDETVAKIIYTIESTGAVHLEAILAVPVEKAIEVIKGLP